jgi:tubulin polyglutamylase TTLL1
MERLTQREERGVSKYKINYYLKLFGLDFMIDDTFKVWLIEVNTNPCLELSCPLLSRIIPPMVENVLR